MNTPVDIKAFSGEQNKPFGAVERMIAMRYLRAKKNQGGVGLIAAISFTCIMLAIAAMIIIMSIMNGFRQDMIRLTVGSEGHMYVSSSSPRPTPESANQLERRLSNVEGVEEAFQFTQNYTGVQANGKFSLAQVIGISPENLRNYELIADSVQIGNLDFFGQGRGAENQIAVGAVLANGLGLTVGDRLLIFSPRTRQTITGPIPVKKVYTIGAIFQVGLYLTDQTYIYMDLNQTTQLFAGGEVTGEIQLRLEDPDALDQMHDLVSKASEEPVFDASQKQIQGHCDFANHWSYARRYITSIFYVRSNGWNIGNIRRSHYWYFILP